MWEFKDARLRYDNGEIQYNPPLMTAKDYIFAAILGETRGAPLVDTLEPMDWSKPPRRKPCGARALRLFQS